MDKLISLKKTKRSVSIFFPHLYLLKFCLNPCHFSYECFFFNCANLNRLSFTTKFYKNRLCMFKHVFSLSIYNSKLSFDMEATLLRGRDSSNSFQILMILFGRNLQKKIQKHTKFKMVRFIEYLTEIVYNIINHI